MKNKICVYAIAKDESKFVDQWCESMKEADVVVVLDTGSTDDTVEKLRSHGVLVKVKKIKPWRFDVARNESLKLVPDDCNILVCTDLDEVLSPGWADILRSKWEEGVHSRASYRFNWSHFPNGEPAIVFTYNKIHNRHWRWKYPVHETLVRDSDDADICSPEEELKLFDSITLDHYQDVNKPRDSYLDLLELREKEHPSDDLFGKLYLAHEYYYRGRYDEAIEKLNKTLLDFDGVMWDIEKASCHYFISSSFFERGDYAEAVCAALKGIAADPTYRECYIAAAKAYTELGRYTSAIAAIKEGLKNSHRHYNWLEDDISWSYEPYDMLCHAYFQSGDMLRALACGYKALTFHPDDDRLNNNVLACLDHIKDEDF